jgi:hypothetical protein
MKQMVAKIYDSTLRISSIFGEIARMKKTGKTEYFGVKLKLKLLFSTSFIFVLAPRNEWEIHPEISIQSRRW